MRVGYIVSEYPKVSHTFIRREIAAVEACGIDIVRISIRDGGQTVDPSDRVEHAQTIRLLDGGASGLLLAGLRCLLRSPARTIRTFWLACRMGMGADRPMPVHWIYFLEAAVVADLVRKQAISHLHAHFGSNPAEVAMLAAQLSDITFSFTAHGTVETDNARAIGLPAKIGASAFVVAVSHYGRAQMMRWIPPDQWSRVHVVHCGLGPEYIDSPRPETETGTNLLAVGRLSEEKGHICLVHAFARLLQAGVNARLVLAGDGPLRGIIERRCIDLGIADRVRITGWVSGDQVRQLLLESRALVLPSFAEGLPVVLMESLALGRPVVSSWVAGVPELVQAGQNGWLVAPGDEDALCQALQDCLNTPADKLTSMGEAGRTAVRLRHDARLEGARLAKLFRSLHRGDRGAQ